MISSPAMTREQIRKIEITQVRDAEDLPFHRALAVGDDRAETAAEFLHDDAGIEAARGLDGGDGGPGDAGANNSRPKLLDRARVARASSCAFSIEFGHADLLHVFAALRPGPE